MTQKTEAQGTTAIEPSPVTPAPLARPAATWTEDQVRLVRDTVAKGATPDELKLFLYTAARSGLDPLTKQIHAIKRWSNELRREVMAIQVGIDGLRLIASRTGDYAGQVGPEWCGPDGVWRDVWLSDDVPAAARVGVIRRGFAQPLYGVARFGAYAQRKRDGGLTSFWARMPDVMLAKVAEALALRKAFPAEMTGLYVAEELRHDDDRPPRTTKAAASRTEAPAQESPADFLRRQDPALVRAERAVLFPAKPTGRLAAEEVLALARAVRARVQAAATKAPEREPGADDPEPGDPDATGGEDPGADPAWDPISGA